MSDTPTGAAARPALPPQYDPSSVESGTYRRWLDAGVFTADPGSPKAPYVIVIPPPNVTDVLHMGHGLNNTLQDILIRFERMRGRETLWLPGSDHAAIATHTVIERQLKKEGKTRQEVGRTAFLERVHAYQKEKGGIILEQLKALGASCDWTRTRFTLDDEYSGAVRHVFVTLHQQGLMYRGHRVIHWCPSCLTSLSDEEAEFHDTEGKLYHIRYPRADGATDKGGVIVATTRPETMFGDVAVVYHPEDERFAGMRGQMVEIPLSGTVIPVETHTAVERGFGTGMLKVTPAHDPNDFEIAKAWPGTEPPIIMTEDGKMSAGDRVPVALRGMDRFAARKKIVEQLEQAGLLVKIETHQHAVRRCYRCDTVVEPRLSDQWFVKMKPLADRALAEFRKGRIRFIPEHWGSVYERWLSEIRDWNVSRQIWFGHRIPAWYCPDGHITVAESTPPACAECGKTVRQDDDVLDTWFSSGLWPFATLGWPKKTRDLARFYPGHSLVTGADIIFFWVARMVMLGYHFLDERPFETVVLNGIVRDNQHRKMSKSLGNGIDPLEVIKRYGADALRYVMTVTAPVGTDLALDNQDLEVSFAPGRNFANKLWNAARFTLSNFETAPAPLSSIDPARFELADRWILSRCHRVIASATEAYARFRLNDAGTDVYQFIWHDLADWYLEQAKPRLYGTTPGGDVARSILAHVFSASLQLLHPVMPFITEELWGHFPGASGLLARTSWPAPDSRLLDTEAENRFARVQALITAVRTIRAEYGIEPGKGIRASVEPANTDALEAFNAEQRTIERLGKISHLVISGGPSNEVGTHAVLEDGSGVFVPLGDAIDVGRECARLSDELARIEKQITTVAATLANEKFIGRAPAEVIEKERARERSAREQREALAGKLIVLGCG
ncbi:MAG: valine--tRNA ligase [Gemmatimonadetes bacterium]|nr:valine--tRNA ligase [Gemmatimonadota bacterium]